MRGLCFILMLVLALAPGRVAAASAAAPVIVASKPFGESYLLAEMFAQLLEQNGIAVVRKPGLGSTEILFRSLRSGAIDLYPEYTGTGLLAVLHDRLPADALADSGRVYDYVSRGFAARWGMRWLPPLGFENVYAIAVRPETAASLKLRTLIWQYFIALSATLWRASSEVMAFF